MCLFYGTGCLVALPAAPRQTHGAHILTWRLPQTCGETSSRRIAHWTGRPWRVLLRRQGPEHESPKKGGTPGTAHARAKQAVGRPTDISKKHKGKQKRGEWKRKSKTKTKKIANADRRRSNSAEGKATNIKKALKVNSASCRATYCPEERTVSALCRLVWALGIGRPSTSGGVHSATCRFVRAGARMYLNCAS